MRGPTAICPQVTFGSRQIEMADHHIRYTLLFLCRFVSFQGIIDHQLREVREW